MSTLHDQIKQVIDTEPVVVFMKGTPEAPACGNSMRALQALWQAGAPITGVDVLPDPRIRQELTALSEWPTIPQVFVKGELIGGADITEELYASGELKEKIDEALGAESRADGAHRRARARLSLALPARRAATSAGRRSRRARSSTVLLARRRPPRGPRRSPRCSSTSSSCHVA